MDFRDVPNLLKFEQHARRNNTCEITMDAYRRVRDIIAAAPKPTSDVFMAMDPQKMMDYKASCEAVEKSTRILWACAVATDHVSPPMWDYTPEYAGTLDYFQQLGDLELMGVTQKHRIVWEQKWSTVSH
jgi:hypothetical protein